MKTGIAVPKFITIEVVEGGWIVTGNDFRKIYTIWNQLETFVKQYVSSR